MLKSPWTVVGLAVVILALQFLRGGVNAVLFVGLAVLLIVGFVFPPLGVGLGAVVALLLLFTTGPTALGKVSGALGGKKA
jgi:hypothetical protein